MSILIKMEMPKNCGECPIYEHLSIHENTFRFCRLTRMETNPIERRDDCPLIELPKYGDLIDKDKLTDAIDNITWYHQNRNKDMVEGANSAEHQAWYREQDVHEAVADAPIVVEGEET